MPSARGVGVHVVGDAHVLGSIAPARSRSRRSTPVMRWKVAPRSAPPMMGASQNTHSWGAPSPLKNATPVERAGLTEVLEIGIDTRG